MRNTWWPVGPVVRSLLEAVYPEQCQSCGCLPAQVPWCDQGPLVAGLKSFDAPHLCLPCLAELLAGRIQEFLAGPSSGNSFRVQARSVTSDRLVRLVGAWKYQGVRGLAWPLAGLLASLLERYPPRPGEVLIPVPLHVRRERERGFNQAEVLAELLARKHGLVVCRNLVRRVRATDQQARIQDGERRGRNIRNAFRVAAGRKSAVDPGNALILVDDIFTSGATVGEMVRTLRSAGYQISRVVCLGAVPPT